jgi:hypothetical protein
VKVGHDRSEHAVELLKERLKKVSSDVGVVRCARYRVHRG